MLYGLYTLACSIACLAWALLSAGVHLLLDLAGAAPSAHASHAAADQVSNFMNLRLSHLYLIALGVSNDVID